MGIEGWQLTLSTNTYRTPSACASCLGPREMEVSAQVTEKIGNVRRTLTMGFPYCNTCGKRATREKRRSVLVPLGGALIGALFAVGACAVAEDLEPTIGFGAAFVVGAGLAIALAFLTRPALPGAPATARGEAVILRDTAGSVLCTNQRFAELLGQANGATAAPAKQWMTTELWAPIAAVLLGVLVLCVWLRYPSHSSSSRTPAAAQVPARRPPPPPKH